MNNLIECTKHNCKILNNHEVEYLIVDGTAVAIHGYPRLSMASDGSILGKHDLDFWYNPTYENYFKLLKALKDIGFERNFLDEKEPAQTKVFSNTNLRSINLIFYLILKDLINFIKHIRIDM